MQIKPFILCTILACSTSVCFAAAEQSITNSTTQSGEQLNSIAAVVNDSVITNADLNKHIKQAVVSMQQNKITPPPADVLRKQVLDQMINRELQLQQAKQMGIIINSDQVDQAIAKIAAGNHMTAAQLYQTVQNSTGQNSNEFRKEIQNELTIQSVQQQAVANRISISQDEVNDDLTQLDQQRSINSYHLKDILIALPDSPTPNQIAATKAKADQVYAQLQKGANFDQAAVSDSNGEQALKAGDLGWRALDELPTPFVSAVQAMKAGDISKPIQAANGFHILKLIEVKSSGLSGTQQEKRSQIEDMIFQREMGQAVENWIAQLRAQAYIKIY